MSLLYTSVDICNKQVTLTQKFNIHDKNKIKPKVNYKSYESIHITQSPSRIVTYELIQFIVWLM